MISRVVIIILDGLGVGALPDAYLYGDEKSNTLGNMSRKIKGGLYLPEMEKMGLGNIISVEGVKTVANPLSSFGKMSEISAGKDTITGHWEMAGLILKEPSPLYPDGFPEEIMGPFEEAIGKKVLGNKVASGTEVIEELGEEHFSTGGPIVYTSVDSVFQVAAHVEVVPLDVLYNWCEIARKMLKDEHAVGRVIARPFTGNPGGFMRTPGRKDYPLKPPGKTILNMLEETGREVISVGKVSDIFGGSGITRSFSTRDNKEGILNIMEVLELSFEGILFANLVDFDMVYGHRNDFAGFYDALKEFDYYLPFIRKSLGEEDMLIITADHGCDPTIPGTDHTREYVPLLVYGSRCKSGVDLGTRESYNDVAATIAEIFHISELKKGKSFAPEIL